MALAATTLQPGSAEEAAAMLAQAARERTPLLPFGNGTHLGPSRPDAAATAISSRGLVSGFAHYSGDLVATLPAGMTLADANAALAAERQWLPLDPLTGVETTIGGLVSTNDSGPRRHGYGSPRDLIIGIEVALTNGTVAHSGGRVVKNVAGYDLGRLFCGSRGSLGLITRVTFKLAPLPQSSCTLVARYATLAEASVAATLVARSPLTPSAVEVVAPDPRLLVRFESTPSSGRSMAQAAAALLTGAREVETLHGDAELQVWRGHRATFGEATAVLKLIVLPSTVATITAAIAALDPGIPLSARAALGVIDLATGSRAMEPFAQLAREHGGHAEVLRGDAALPADRSSASSVMRAVKQQFDPAGILPYPWDRH